MSLLIEPEVVQLSSCIICRVVLRYRLLYYSAGPVSVVGGQKFSKYFLNLIEPDTIKEILRLENMSGAQCLVANTAEATRARLRHVGLEQQAQGIIHAAIEIAQSLVPQHLL